MFDMLKSMSIAVGETRSCLCDLVCSRAVMQETQPALGIKDVRLDVPEGLYMIRVGSSMECVECEHIKSSPSYVHAYVAPFGKSINPYQLWTIYSRRGLDFRYTIRNFATGSVLDRQLGDDGGNQVVCWSSRGGDTQTWELMGSRQSETWVEVFPRNSCPAYERAERITSTSAAATRISSWTASVQAGPPATIFTPPKSRQTAQ